MDSEKIWNESIDDDDNDKMEIDLDSVDDNDGEESEKTPKKNGKTSNNVLMNVKSTLTTRRQKTRLIKQMKKLMTKFVDKIGQQAVLLFVTPAKPSNSEFTVFGSKALENVMKNLHRPIIERLEIEHAIAQTEVNENSADPNLFELPRLLLDGSMCSTSVNNMTQAQLRHFIPTMLKYSTGRGKPGWGKAFARPPWWPQTVPWENVRMDQRSDYEKERVSWTYCLRQIVISCYKHHGREDLLYECNESEENIPPNDTVEMEHENVVVGDGTGSANDDTVSGIVVHQVHPLAFYDDKNNSQVILQGQLVGQSFDGNPVNMGGLEKNNAPIMCDADIKEEFSVNVTDAMFDSSGQVLVPGTDGKNYPLTIGDNMIFVPIPTTK